MSYPNSMTMFPKTKLALLRNEALPLQDFNNVCESSAQTLPMLTPHPSMQPWFKDLPFVHHSNKHTHAIKCQDGLRGVFLC